MFAPIDIRLAEVGELDPIGIVISPGPGHPAKPRDIGSCLEIILHFPDTPILGVCLGHQAMNLAYGGTISHTRPLHGKTSEIRHDGRGIFRGVENPLQGGRYHSLAVERLAPDLEVAASTPEGVVMGIRHKTHPHCWSPVPSRVSAHAFWKEDHQQLGRGRDGMHPLIEGILEASRSRGFKDATSWPKEERRDLISSASALKSRGIIPVIAEIKPKALGRSADRGRGGRLRPRLCRERGLCHLCSHRAHALSGLSGKRPYRPEVGPAGLEKGLHLRRATAFRGPGRSGAAHRCPGHRSQSICGCAQGPMEWNRWSRSTPGRSWRRL